jgi:hypothetical protein
LASQRKKFGVIGAGAVSKSLIGCLQEMPHELGPVAAVSYRVASRIANTLRAGYPVRNAVELAAAACVLFHAPPEQMEGVLTVLEAADIQWMGRALVFCDCDVPQQARNRLQARGASTATVRKFGIPGLLAVDGSGLALRSVQRIARLSKMKALQLAQESRNAFDAAITLANAAITPLIDGAAGLLRKAGVRDVEAAQVAAALFEQTARDYAHSGKQSWIWYMRKPGVLRIEAQIAAAGTQMEPMLRGLLLFGLDSFEKHEDLAAVLREGMRVR